MSAKARVFPQRCRYIRMTNGERDLLPLADLNWGVVPDVQWRGSATHLGLGRPPQALCPESGGPWAGIGSQDRISEMG